MEKKLEERMTREGIKQAQRERERERERAGNFPLDVRKSRNNIWAVTGNKLTTILGDPSIKVCLVECYAIHYLHSIQERESIERVHVKTNKVKTYEERMKKVKFFRIKEPTLGEDLLTVIRNIKESPTEQRPSFLLREKQQEILS